jgi:dolichol-phosphate mannosyltransferase
VNHEPQPTSTRTLVVVPTYNEAQMIGMFLEEFEATGMECLIVDDASPDGTGELADQLAADRPWLHVLHRSGKDGLGAAYRSGFEWALEHDYDLVGQMDCDLSHPPAALGAMVRKAEEGADLVLGSRYVEGGGTVGWPMTRKAISRTGCVAACLLLRLPYPDLSGGFKLWRAETLRRIEVDQTVSNGYVFQVETTLRAHLSGAAIAQHPFVFTERLAGESKMDMGIAIEGARVLRRLRHDGWQPTAGTCTAR